MYSSTSCTDSTKHNVRIVLNKMYIQTASIHVMSLFYFTFSGLYSFCGVDGHVYLGPSRSPQAVPKFLKGGKDDDERN